MLSIIQNLLSIFSIKQKKFLLLIILLLSLSSVFEFFILLYILDVFQFLAGFEDLKVLTFIEKVFNLDRNISLLFYILIFIFIIKFILTIFVSYLRLNFQKNMGIFISNKLLKRYLYEDILNLRNKKNSDLTRNIEMTTSQVANGALQHVFTISSEIVIITLIFVLLSFVNYAIITFSLSIIIITSCIYYYFFKKKIETVGQNFHTTAAEKLKLATETLNGSLEIRAFKSQEFFLKKYFSSSLNHFHSTFVLLFVQQIPRHLIELLVVLIISVSIFILDGNFSNNFDVMKTLGIFGLASFRLIPSSTKIIHALQGLKYTLPAINEIASEVEGFNKSAIDHKKNYNNSKFNINKNFNEIVLKNINFKYPDRNNHVFENISLKIKKNSKNLIVGESGAGKTTLLNLLLGFIKPVSGEIYLKDEKEEKKYVNNLNLSNLLGYVPQKTYLINDTIKNNITFGAIQKNISDKQVLDAIRFSGLEDFVKKLKKGIDTELSDFASNLSGGQAQRISIARCKFKGSEILIFDEPFSSLDYENEKNILSNINMLSSDKTLIIISHRKIDTIRFDNVFQINNNKITKIS